MKEDICSIPVNEILAVHDGCPICRMYDKLEEHVLDFIMGPAMMEPDVRIETNRAGFCADHSKKMLGRKNRLGLALMLESRLKTVRQGILPPKTLLPQKAKSDRAESCYVCAWVDKAMEESLRTFFKLWGKEAEFRENFISQPIVCLPHYGMLLERGKTALDKKSFADFDRALRNVVHAGLTPLEEDLSGFCRMFDYHNIGADWGGKRDAPERAVAFLTGRRTNIHS